MIEVPFGSNFQWIKLNKKIGEDLQVWTVGTGPVLSNSFLSDFYGKNYPNKGLVLYTMIHTFQLEQPCYLVDKHGPHIVVHSYKLVIFYKFSFGDLLKHQDFDLSLYYVTSRNCNLTNFESLQTQVSHLLGY